MDDMVLQRIFTKLDNIETKVSDLCIRVANIEQYHEIQDKRVDDNKWGWNRFFGIAATIGMVVVILLSVL
jgi:hypothetical protein|tara:strand:- start:51 stop:260 length:210 start_codon:yes stop_codon:yes gene_type:complete